MGTMQDFNDFWDSIQQDKDKLQVGVCSVVCYPLALIFARFIKIE